MFGLIRTVALVVIAIVVTAFFLQNFATTEVAFLTWSIVAPRAVVFLIVFGFGFAAGFLMHALSPRRQVTPRKTASETPPVHREPEPPSSGGD
jgi:uncharacterized integral membrane protein